MQEKYKSHKKCANHVLKETDTLLIKEK